MGTGDPRWMRDADERDRLIEERTEARAEAFREKERADGLAERLKTTIGHLGEAHETIMAFQEASGLYVPDEEKGGDPGGVEPRHVGNHIDRLTKRADGLAKRVEELEDMARELWFHEVVKYDARKNAEAIDAIVREGALVDKRRGISIATRRAGRAS